MNVLSLFGGIECGRVAFDRMGIKVDKYYSSEIEQNPIKVAINNYPDIIQLGDITLIDNTILSNLPKIDILIGGSPCQTFSNAGLRTGFDGKSGLYYEYSRILKWVQQNNNPNVSFMLENVRMKKEWEDVITNDLGVSPVLINSSLVSAQQRLRCYWTNIGKIEQPDDKNIILQDILEDGLALSNKAYCLTVSGKQGLTVKGFEHWLQKKVDNFVLRSKPIRLGHFNTGGQGDRIYSVSGKSVCLSANGGGRGAKTGLYYVGENESDILVNYDNDEFIKKNIRKLTRLECERLQTLPEGYTNCIPISEAYKCIGNGWTVDVIVHILSYLNKQNIK